MGLGKYPDKSCKLPRSWMTCPGALDRVHYIGTYAVVNFWKLGFTLLLLLYSLLSIFFSLLFLFLCQVVE